MKKLLLTTACLFVLGGQAWAAPCNAKVQALQKQVDAVADRTDKITNKCSSEWFETVKRYLELTRRYEEAAQRDKGCKINPPDMIGISLGILEDVKRTCSAEAKKKKPANPDNNIWTDYVAYKETPEEKAEYKKGIIEAEEGSRNEVPRTRKPAPVARALVVKANSLLKGNPTCFQMLQASKLLDKAGDEYDKAKAQFLGDAPDRTLYPRVAWLEGRAENGWCKR
jgi:hypothetical protein